MRYKYKDPLGYEREYDGDMDDILDFTKALKPRYCVAGIDLSATTDLTCASIIFKVPDDDQIVIISSCNK